MVSRGPSALLGLLALGIVFTPGTQGQKPQLRVEPQNPLVLAGTSFLLNCSTDCPQPQNIILETYLSKETVGSGPGWKTFQLANLTENIKILCVTYCQGEQITNDTSIITYEFPASVHLDPLPLWLRVGENFNLSCRVEGGAPRTQLTIVLLRGAEELRRQLALGQPAMATATVRARREDHGASFSCRTELDLRAQGLKLFQNSSTPRQLRTFVLPETRPRISVSRYLEVGKLWQAMCSLDGLFPTSEAQVQMMLRNHMLHTEVSKDGDRLMAWVRANENEAQEGTHEMVCSVTLAGEKRESRENVTFFSFSGPNLTLSEPNAPEGTIVNVICAAGPQVRVWLDGVWAPGPGQPVILQLNATDKDDRRTFSCNATFEEEGEILHKSTSVQLRVLYGPKIEGAKCPQRLIWEEETTQVFLCQARGNPDPLLKCLQSSSGNPVPVGIPLVVKLNYSGTYDCQATSSLGKYTLTVEIDVQDRNPFSVTIILTVLVILGTATVAAGLAYVSRFQKRSNSYHVKQKGNWSSLAPTQQSDEAMAEVAV